MLKTVLPGYKILYRDGGEPYLIPGDFQISVSHSFPLAALAISKNRVGIDLEKRKEKIKDTTQVYTERGQLYRQPARRWIFSQQYGV
jgi:phosphopantetheinyl transferase